MKNGLLFSHGPEPPLWTQSLILDLFSFELHRDLPSWGFSLCLQNINRIIRISLKCPVCTELVFKWVLIALRLTSSFTYYWFWSYISSSIQVWFLQRWGKNKGTHETNWKNKKKQNKLLPLFAQLATFNFLDLLGAEDQHAVLEAAHLTRGGFPRRRGCGQRPLLVPCGVGRRTKKVSNQ